MKLNCRTNANKRRKLNVKEDNDELEQQYEETNDEEIKLKALLPIKTKHGIVPQNIVDDGGEVGM